MNLENIKQLDCSFRKAGSWNNMEVVSLPIADLWASCPIAEVLRGRVFFDAIVKDIAAEGLMFPLLVVRSTRAEVTKQKKRYPSGTNELPFWSKDDQAVMMYTVWGGSNRIEAARELGYTHIDCVVMTDFDKARGMQSLHRAPFKGKLY